MMNKGLSKSRYTAFCQCEKALWLKLYKPEVTVVDDATLARLEAGNVVGDLAMGLLGEYTEMTTRKADGGLDLKAMCVKTQECMANGVENIAEASFSVDGNFCAVDILHKTPTGWAIYEVKSSTYKKKGKSAEYGTYAHDIAYQKWVLTKCGVNITGTYLVLIDAAYVLQGELDIQQFFHVIDLADMVEQAYLMVPEHVMLAKQVMNRNEEPDTDLSINCHKPGTCAFWKYCISQKHLPTPSVLNLYRLSFSQKLKYLKAGYVSIDDIRHEHLNKI